ncbi:hypothetical protein TRFO_06654 [Tritrichomonas foetus]|uniref:Uncharacterized protein n=1 Tax=Tritrichomonas foetus TaxID=1144522 RepID=A0A1J4JWP1_9EUKA|nr:hypothetical protein TRFO_06654 [Tritrichomonas foetus]|eukprot:OHT03427.1 hypothetical protein TRFO_06654 [Tritrichomonas foetus]
MPSQLLNHSQQIQQTPPYQGLPPNNPIPPNINPSNAISLINTPPNQLSIPHSNSLMTNSNINPIYIQNSLNRTPHYAPQSPSFPTIDTTKPPHTQTHQQQHQHQNQYQVLTSMQPNAKSPHLVSSMDDLSTLIPPLHMKNSAVSAPIDGAGMGHREEHHVHIDNSDEVDHQGHIHKNSQSEIFSIGSPKGILLNPVAKDGHKPHPPKEISEVGNHVNHITIQAPSFDGKLYSVY